MGCEQMNFQVVISIFKVIRAKECSYGGVGSVCGGQRWGEVDYGGSKAKVGKEGGRQGGGGANRRVKPFPATIHTSNAHEGRQSS